MADGPPYGIEYVRVELCAFVFHQLYCGTDAMGNIRYGRHYANDGESNTKDFQRREVAFELCVSCLQRTRRRSKTGRQTLFVPEAGQQLIVLFQCVLTGSGVKIGSNGQVLCSHLSRDKMVIAREEVIACAASAEQEA